MSVVNEYEEIVKGQEERRKELVSGIVNETMQKAGDYRKEKGYPLSALLGLDAVLSGYLYNYEGRDGHLGEVLERIAMVSQDLEAKETKKEDLEILGSYGGRWVRGIYREIFLDKVKKKSPEEMEEKYGLKYSVLMKLLQDGVTDMFCPL